jgi:selenocysteine-specific elongation factor
MPREDFRNRVELDSRRAESALATLKDRGVIRLQGPRISLDGFAPELDSSTARAASELARRFEESPHSPPSIHECIEAVGLEAWTLLVDQGRYVSVAEDVAFAKAVYRRLVGEIASALDAGESVTVALVRDRYGTTRKYALALLEHMDKIGVSVRVGDERRRGTAPPPGA